MNNQNQIQQPRHQYPVRLPPIQPPNRGPDPNNQNNNQNENIMNLLDENGLPIIIPRLIRAHAVLPLDEDDNDNYEHN